MKCTTNKIGSKKMGRLSIFLVLLVMGAAFLAAQTTGGAPPAGAPPAGGGDRGGMGGGFGGPGGFGNPADLTNLPTKLSDFKGTDFLALIRRTDIRSSFYDSDMTATINMVNVSPTRGTTSRKEIIYRRDKDDAMLMLTLEPESRKGQGMLRVDNNMWRYDPTSRQFTHTTLKATYDENSTARNSDFRRLQRSLDYTVENLTEGTLGKYPVWIAELKANNDEVPYPYMKMWIEKDRTIVLKVEEYSLSKTLLRTSYYTNYVQIGNSFIPTTQIFQDGLIPEKRSQVTYTDISTKPVPDDVFTKNYLERMSK